MLVTGIILAPVAMATPAIQDLMNLRTVVNIAAVMIGDPNNPNKGWGFGSSVGGQMGTADLVNNITTTVLGMKFQVDTNKTAWLLPENATGTNLNDTNATVPAPWTPTLPLSSSMALPSTVPTAVTNATVDLSISYTDYVSAIPNLSTSLITLGRAYHREYNTPVREALAGLQQAIATLQSALLQDNLISPQAVVRTLRASSSLESAQTAWGRLLNLPGRAGSNDGSSDASTISRGLKRRLSDKHVGADAIVEPRRGPPSGGRFYTHEELWGRSEKPQEVADTTPEITRVHVHVPFIA